MESRVLKSSTFIHCLAKYSFRKVKPGPLRLLCLPFTVCKYARTIEHFSILIISYMVYTIAESSFVSSYCCV